VGDLKTLLLLLILVGTCWGQSGAAKKLVGTWNLVRFVDTPEGSAPLYRYGEHPVGQFIYTADGYVSIHIMHDPADLKPAPDVPGLETASRYTGYFGTYTVLESENIVIHHVTGGNLSSYIATDQRRPFHLDGNTLTIGGIRTMPDGLRVRWERVLIRASPAR
jgi:hypothetical protein